MKKNFLITLITVLLINFLNGQSLRFDRINVLNGLSQNSVFSLELDSTGNVWAGTLNGLNRINGQHIDVFKSGTSTHQLCGNYVTALQTDKYGNLWIAIVNGGINCYLKNKKQFIHFSNPELNRFIMEGFNDLIIEEDSLLVLKNNINLGFYDLKSNNFQAYTPAEKNIRGILPFQTNSILLYGMNGLTQLRISTGDIEEIQLLDRPVYAMIAFNNSFVIASTNGIYRYSRQLTLNDTLLEFNNSSPHPDPTTITSLAISKNELWIGSTDGLYAYSNTANDSIDGFLSFKNHSLSKARITRLKWDANGNLWIGTINTGVIIYSPFKNQFQLIPWEHDEISNVDQTRSTRMDPVRAMCRTRAGRLWIGFESRGVGYFDSSTGKKKHYYYFINEDGHEENLYHVRRIFEDSMGNIWVAFWDNVCYYNRQRDRFEALNYKYSWSWPYTSFFINEFEPGKLTITGDNRITTFDIRNGKSSTLPRANNGVILWNALRDLKYDSFNNLWVVQNNNGLVKIDLSDTSFTHITTRNHGLSDFKVYAMEIQGDSLWIASVAGLDLFSIQENKVIKTYNEKNGLSNDVVYSVFLDENKMLWMSTAKGISRLDTKSGKLSVYLNDLFFTSDAFFFDHKPYIYYGGFEGIVVFNPNSITDTRKSPQPILDDFYLFNKKTAIGDTINRSVLLPKPLYQLSELRLKHQQNSFSISFNAYPFNYPSDHQFRYRLQNMQESWIYPEDGRNTANYTTVPPGNYTFEVAVSKRGDEWNNPARINIIIIPPLWQRLWFRIAFAMFLLGIIYFSVRYRMTQIKRINLILEQRVEEQTRELKEQNQQIKAISDKLHEADQSKLRFFTNISHEFRTPLTLILGHLPNPNNQREERANSIIRNNAIRLLNLVNQLLEIRKMDQDKLKLHISPFDLIAFTKHITYSFQSLAKNKNISLQFYSECENLEVWLDTDKMEKILYNLISNALKYTPNGYDILVEVKNSAEGIMLIVEDSGIGIAPDDMDRIFDRFFRSAKSSSGGHGIGLSLVKALTEFQQGTISVSSELDKGTRFTLRFKSGKEHFKADDFGATTQEESIQIESSTPTTTELNMTMDYKVLVVEDNLELQDYICSMLHKQFVVKSAENGKEALEVLKDFMPDLIISDIMMPVMDGIRFCTEVKANIETSHIPFVFLTAKTDVGTQIEGYAKGIDDFIEKPFRTDVFLARIKAMLGNREILKKHLASSLQIPEAIEKANVSKNDKAFWKKLNKAILDNYHNSDFNTELLSEAMHMSRTTFYRKFKGLTGQNSADHIRKFRLYKAAELLLEQELDVTQVSASVGFKSLSQFRINFKEEFGKTPSEYQKGK